MPPSYYAGEVVDGQLYVVTGYAAATANQLDCQAKVERSQQWSNDDECFSANILY